MKRRQRKTVLDINGESDSPRRRWPNERQSQNGSPSNPLANLLGQYNSDSEADDDTRPRAHKLNDQVNDFLKEIQSIAPEDSNKNNRNSSMSQPGSYWQECYDEQTGYPYYWHTETNQVTWEVPPELKVQLEKTQREANTSHGSHIPQWSNSMASNKFSQSQSNIPEGMIPKEVVVRNRNRQAGILNKPAKPPAKANNSKSPGFNKDDFDEGKIEMITSFGNDESESDESEREEPQKKPSILKKPPLKSSQHVKPPPIQDQSSKATESSDSKSSVVPMLPPMQYGPQNKQKLSERLSQNIQTSKTTATNNSSSASSSNNNEEDILQRLKNQAKLLQILGGNNKSKAKGESDRDATQRSAKDLKLSLVPGYEDDSDGGEDESASSSNRKQARPLFPISETQSTSISESTSSEKLAKRIETVSGNIRVYEYRNVDTAEEKSVEECNTVCEANVDERLEDGRTEQEAKANKFLESIDAPTKAFQRKRRIAFDVAPNKSRTQESQDSSTGKDESYSGLTSGAASLSDGTERRGLGFSKEEAGVSTETESNRTDAEATSVVKKSIAFVKEDSNAGGNSVKTKEISEAEKAILRALTEPIMEKLKFLSEGSPAASAVQVMAIQIQTLLCAWEAGDLQEPYLRNWLVGTGCELTRLEQTAAPPGWECQWDRSHKRYYYRNTSTGEAQWTYPETDIVGGTEEMELCTTPPPPEHVETPIIEMSAQVATLGSSSIVKDGPKPPEPSDHLPGGDTPAPPPPPPTISSPSPPPPPRIYAEDLKRGRKRKSSPDTSADKKDEDSSKEGKSGLEPLPPGVDPPEIAYSLPASALEAGVLYGAQQTNPIYAATLAGAGIPLISHHHTALMQGQLMHYNPAYHQHLHNQALVAARLSGQEAVQFMVAEYARVYENNQVIAKPPMKMPHETSLGSAINSFYSDIASIEKTTADIEKEKAELRLAESIPSPVSQVPQTENDLAAAEAMKEKKKKKLKTGIGKKQKEMSSMVAKWQRAQKNYKEGH